MEQRSHSLRLEALADEVMMNASEHGRIGEVDAATHAASERPLEQFHLIDVGKHLGDGIAGDVACDAERLNPPNDACAATMPQAHLGSRAGNCRAPIVERALPMESHDRRVDLVLFEFALCEAGTQLCFCKFSTGQEGETGDVGPIGAGRH